MGRRKQLGSDGEKEIKKRKDLKATSPQPYGISDKEQALLLVKISCQSTGHAENNSTFNYTVTVAALGISQRLMEHLGRVDGPRDSQNDPSQ